MWLTLFYLLIAAGYHPAQMAYKKQKVSTLKVTFAYYSLTMMLFACGIALGCQVFMFFYTRFVRNWTPASDESRLPFTGALEATLNATRSTSFSKIASRKFDVPQTQIHKLNFIHTPAPPRLQ